MFYFHCPYDLPNKINLLAVTVIITQVYTKKWPTLIYLVNRNKRGLHVSVWILSDMEDVDHSDEFNS